MALPTFDALSRVRRVTRTVGEVRFVPVIAVLAVLLAAAPASAQELLPDIDMRPPDEITRTTDSQGRTYVAFGSTVDNVGPGILKLVGNRTLGDKMSVQQVVLDAPLIADAKRVRNLAAGEMQFAPAGGHDHWHYLGFEDYMLLSVPDLNFAAPTRKTGFCLLGLKIDFECGKRHPEYTQIGDPSEATDGTQAFPDTDAMGLVVKDTTDDAGNRRSWDYYEPSIEGQDIEITTVRNGRYCLSFVANPDELIAEVTTANNGASRLIDIGTAANGSRTVTLVPNAVYPDSGTCGLTKPVPTTPAPGTGGTGTGGPGTGGTGGGAGGEQPLADPTPSPRPLTERSASRLARSAIVQKFRRPAGLARRCRVVRTRAASCRVGFRQSTARYAGTVSLNQRAVAGEWRWFYRLNIERKGRARCASCPPRVRTRTLFGGVLQVDRKAAQRALRLPAGPPAATRAGVAWSNSMLCPISRARIAAREQVG